MFLALAGHLIDRQHLDMLQDHGGKIPRTSAVVGSRQRHIDEVAGEDEAGHSAHVVDCDGHGPLALLDKRRQRGSLIRRPHLRGDDRRVAEEGGGVYSSAALGEPREVRECPLRAQLRRPADFSHVLGADWRAKSKRIGRDQNRHSLLAVCPRRMALKPASSKKCGEAAKNYSNNEDCKIRTPVHSRINPCPKGTVLCRRLFISYCLPTYICQRIGLIYR